MADEKPYKPYTQADDFLGLCMAIGYVSLNWASIEQDLDMWIALIYHDLGGRQEQPQIPVSLTRKLSFLRRAFKTITALKTLEIEAASLLSRVRDLAGKRHDLIHGALANLQPIEGRWHMIRFEYETPKGHTNWHVAKEFTFSQKDFQDLEAKLVPLAGETPRFGHRLLALIRQLQYQKK